MTDRNSEAQADLTARRQYQSVGDLTWYQQRGPKLSVGEVCGLLAGASLLVASDTFARLTQPTRTKPQYVDLSMPSLAETEISQAARSWAHDALPHEVFQHSERTLLFATIEWLLAGGTEGEWGDLNLDALRIAGLFHDSTLHLPAIEGDNCFTVGSADLAAQFARDHGLSRDVIEQIVVAIAANPSTRVSYQTHGIVAAALSAGGLDEMLSRQYRIDPRNAQEIAENHPWNEFTTQVREHMKFQNRQYPGSRFAYTGPLLNVILRLSARHR